MAHSKSISALNRVGGALCLDFINTVGWRVTPQPKEWLKSYRDLIHWCHQSSIVTDREMKELLDLGEENAAGATRILDTGRALRESLYRIFSAFAHDRLPVDSDVKMVNGMLPDTLARLHLSPIKGGCEWQWHRDALTFDDILRPVVRSAAELLTSSEVARVKECANQGCGWVFIDTSKNHSRRWCDMKDCGNRSKAQRHYHKTRKK